MRQPPCYTDSQHPDHVCLLKHSLYGLKQAPKAWFHRLHGFLLSVGFAASKIDVSLFHYSVDSDFMFVLVYVDDILVMGSSQQRYMLDILKRAGMSDCKPLSTPISVSRPVPVQADPYDDPTRYRSIVGALQYLIVTRPDLSFAVNQLCQHMHAPTDHHWEQLKRVLRYVKGTLSYGLHIQPSNSRELHAFSDSNWAGCPEDRKSTSGFAVCKKQRTVARSSTEAEYKVLADVCAEVTWISSLLRELQIANVNFISTKDQLANIFTKALPGSRFVFIRDKLQVASLPCA
ncbi:uncharacterized protein LOC116005775 [Ipomoea triloba]|uniref:uncharacterized protein LOC116005775 n=1 Tax=Ipomoea triloba TaxID=35885 RepID=UPI00125D6824|nr:uncharacterized protein LOC116005775 [Ipomoea triloba]